MSIQSKNIVIIAGSFHKKEIELMVTEARLVAKETGITIKKVIWVPGSLEKPITLKKAFQDPSVDGAVILGIIERGQTKHGLVMGQSVTSAIIDIQLEFMKPVGMGILGPEILPEQIEPRLKPYARDAMLAVYTMFDVLAD